ncbi:MAG: type II toxin-antitoxin system RelE/ParE family toxin [Oligoflexia bacterium]|nr:type II toxin-antitoxin system RelE/ParE family toxin [Oligoflexia bacterium]
MAIRSFADGDTAKFFETGRIGKGVGWHGVLSVARRKLDMVHYAARLEDLRSPPGNRLEALSDDLVGYHSIRINDQWRVVFRWQATGPEEVRICDYHS